MVHLALTVGITLGMISMVFGVELHYSCNPSGSITVDNPNQSLYVIALAVLTNGDLECTVLPTFNRQTFVIVGCPISHNISFTLMIYLLAILHIQIVTARRRRSIKRFHLGSGVQPSSVLSIQLRRNYLLLLFWHMLISASRLFCIRMLLQKDLGQYYTKNKKEWRG